MFKVNSRNTRTRCEICSKLTIKTPERRVVLVFLLLTLNIFHILFFVFLLLTLNRKIPAELRSLEVMYGSSDTKSTSGSMQLSCIRFVTLIVLGVELSLHLFFSFIFAFKMWKTKFSSYWNFMTFL